MISSVSIKVDVVGKSATLFDPRYDAAVRLKKRTKSNEFSYQENPLARFVGIRTAIQHRWAG